MARLGSCVCRQLAYTSGKKEGASDPSHPGEHQPPSGVENGESFEPTAPASEVEQFNPKPIVRSLTAFAAAHERRDDNDLEGAPRNSDRAGFWKILEVQNLSMDQVEDISYGNKPFSGLMLVLLCGAYIAVTVVIFEYYFTL